MTLQEIRANLGELLNEAVKKGAFDLVQANAAINSLIAFDNHLKRQQAQTMDAPSDPTNPPIPPDPSKPKD